MSVRRRSWKTSKNEEKEAWVVDYTDSDGDRHIETFQKKRDADAYHAKVRNDVADGTHTPVSKSITVREAGENWIKAVELEGREASTIAQYRQHAVHINERIGGLKLAKLTGPRVNALRDELLASMSRAMAKKVVSSLKSLLKDAQRRGEVAQNVALSVKGIKSDTRREGRKLKIGIDIPSADEMRAILAAAAPKAKPLILTAVFTGLRSSEIRGLRWEDVNLKKGELEVTQRADRYGLIGPPKSEAGHRSIPVGPMVLNALREWKLVCPHGEHNLVFPSPDGGVALHNNVVRPLKAAVQAAGLKDSNGKPKYTGPHALRHFFASWCINPVERGGQGLPPKDVQRLLGHSTLAMTTDTYGHLFPANEDAAKRLADAERALLA
jgi:integrase